MHILDLIDFYTISFWPNIYLFSEVFENMRYFKYAIFVHLGISEGFGGGQRVWNARKQAGQQQVSEPCSVESSMSVAHVSKRLVHVSAAQHFGVHVCTYEKKEHMIKAYFKYAIFVHLDISKGFRWGQRVWGARQRCAASLGARKKKGTCEKRLASTTVPTCTAACSQWNPFVGLD
jgi:hypothetical protein